MASPPTTTARRTPPPRGGEAAGAAAPVADPRAPFLEPMLLIRRTEETLLDLFGRGLLNGTTHTSIGQEACAVGVIHALDRDRDVVFSNHRCHGHFLAYGGSLDLLFGEVMGKDCGTCRGIGGSQHLHYRNFYSNGVQGGIVPAAVGMAVAERHKRSGAVVAVFLGDGTLGEGQVYEAFNIASLWGLPLLFVVEANGYAQSTPTHLQLAGRIADRPRAFGIATEELAVRGPDQVHGLAAALARDVRRECRPRCLVLHTYRLGPHSKGDDLRPEEELAAARARDPLARMLAELPRAAVDAAAGRVDAAIRESLERCSAAGTLPGDAFRRIARITTTTTAAAAAAGEARQGPVTAAATFLQSLNQGLHRACRRDPGVFVIGEDLLDPYGGAFKVTRGLSTAFPDRVLATPISEATIVGLGAGMALRGLKPVVEIMFGDFIGLCFDQLYNHAAKYRAMYADQVEVPLVVRTPVGAGRGYGPTHSQSPEKHLLGIPHLKVVAPTLFHDPGALLEAAIADPEPVVFVEHKLLYPARLAAPDGAGAGNGGGGDGGEGRRLWVDRLEGGDGRYPTARVANFAGGDGRADVLLVTYGGGSRHLEDLLLRLADDEIRVACLLPSLINRFEVEPLAEAARGAGAGCVVWEEGPRGFDWGAEVVARLHEALDDRPGGAAVRIRRLASWPTVVPAARHLEDMILPGPAEVERAIVELLADSLR